MYIFLFLKGYRTLCFAYRILDEPSYKEWDRKYQTASLSKNNRNKMLTECADEIENEFFLIGATAIEDVLQEVSLQ